MRGGEGLNAHSGDFEDLARHERLKRQAGEVFARFRRARAREQRPVEAFDPHGHAAHMVAVLVREDKRTHVVLVQVEVVHAGEHLPAGKAVIDHDEPLRPFDEGAVALRPASEDVKVKGTRERRCDWLLHGVTGSSQIQCVQVDMAEGVGHAHSFPTVWHATRHGARRSGARAARPRCPHGIRRCGLNGAVAPGVHGNARYGRR